MGNHATRLSSTGHLIRKCRLTLRKVKKKLAAREQRPNTVHSGRHLENDIIESYQENGFYIFENVLDQAELTDIEADLKNLQGRLPRDRTSKIDGSGDPPLTNEIEPFTGQTV
ncbi:MAG: hypothetical protein CM1200mP4_3430 [Rhodospirillaceae bacterium]|nr:MAG: hypothetical protein CM1200mP4_3430 [Rhodospirillaceae bacterium]